MKSARPSKYIENYENAKNRGVNLLPYLTDAINEFVVHSQEPLESKKNKNLPQFVRKGLQLFSSQKQAADTEVRSNQAIRELLGKLLEIEYEDIPLIHQLLIRCAKDLPKNSEIRQFIEHVDSQLVSINFNERLATNEEEQAVDLQGLLARKDLAPNLFNRKGETIALQQSFSDHVAWAFRNIYSIHYPNDNPEPGKPARVFHGVQHVSRASAYIPILANLYQRHDPNTFQSLGSTPEERGETIKLLQIATLFHDSAREGEDVDLWDRDSGVFCYYYLTKILKVSAEKAKLIAEAIANKDLDPKGYWALNVDPATGNMIWKLDKSVEKKTKNIYQKLIHDADCLDIIRARDRYEGRHLDFYQNIACKNPVAKKEMGILIAEARSLIDLEGDTRNRVNFKIKSQYENENAYRLIEEDIERNIFGHKVMPTLYGGGRLLSSEELQKFVFVPSYDKSKGETQENMEAALLEGRFFIRGVYQPTGIAKRQRPDLPQALIIAKFVEMYEKLSISKSKLWLEKILAELKESYKLKPNEKINSQSLAEILAKGYKTLGKKIMDDTLFGALSSEMFNSLDPIMYETLTDLELRKASREYGVPTRSAKLDKSKKSGNPMRSTSLVGYGATPYCAAGFVFLDPPMKSLRGIDSKDNDSGRGKRGKVITTNLKAALNLENADEATRLMALDDLRSTLIMGGPDPRVYTNQNFKSTHVEVTADITKYDAIYFSQDSCVMNWWMYNQQHPIHPYSPLLQAIYLQKEYERKYEENFKVYQSTRGPISRSKYEEIYGKSKLPIYEYSGIHNFVKKIDPVELTDEKIISYWLEAADSYMKKQLAARSPNQIMTIPLEAITADVQEKLINDLKILCMHGSLNAGSGAQASEKNVTADVNYDSQLREKLSNQLFALYVDLRKKHANKMIDDILNAKSSLLDDSIYYKILQNEPVVLADSRIKEKVQKEVTDKVKLITKDEFFKNFPGGELPSETIETRQNILPFAVGNIEKKNDKLLRLLNLCDKFGLEKEKKLIQQKASEYAKNLIKDIQKEITAIKEWDRSNRFSVEGKLTNLINFCNKFSITQEHQTVIDKLFKQLTYSFLQNETDMLNITEFVAFLKTNKKFDQEVKNFIRDKYIPQYIEPKLNNGITAENCEALYIGNDVLGIMHYLALAKLIEIPIEQQKTMIEKNLANTPKNILSMDLNKIDDTGNRIILRSMITYFQYLKNQDLLDVKLTQFFLQNLKLPNQMSNEGWNSWIDFYTNIPEDVLKNEPSILKEFDAHARALFLSQDKKIRGYDSGIFQHYAQFVSKIASTVTELPLNSSIRKVLDPVLQEYMSKFMDMIIELPKANFIKDFSYPIMYALTDLPMPPEQLQRIKDYIKDQNVTANDVQAIYNSTVARGDRSRQILLQELLPPDIFKQLQEFQPDVRGDTAPMA